ncbi:MAG: pilus assembly protein PilM [bacterium]|nr:pilus assembly protein PilM [bacterium]
MQESFQSALGLELTDDLLIFAEIQNSENGPVVKHLKRIPLPPKVISGGSINDPEILSEQISKALSESKFSSSIVIIGIQDNIYIKSVERRFGTHMEAHKAAIDEKISRSYPFNSGRIDYSFGYQLPEIKIDPAIKSPEQNKVITPVLYAAVKTAKIDELRDLIALTDLSLSAVDLTTLAIIRAVLWNQHLHDDSFLMIIVEDNVVDLNFIENGNICYTHSMRRNITRVEEDVIDVEDIYQHICYFIMAYYNSNPKGRKFNKILFFSRNPKGKKLIASLKKQFPNYETQDYSPFSNINFEPDNFSESKSDSIAEESLPSIGLALKYFEKYNTTLSLIKVKKVIGPVFNKLELAIAGITLALILSLFLLSSFYMQSSARSNISNTKRTKNLIRKLQTGKYLVLQKEIRDIKAQIKEFDKLRLEDFSKSKLLKDLSTELPEDITFKSLSVLSNKISIQGKAFSQTSIFKFYNRLSKIFKAVKINQITTDSRKKSYPVNIFSMEIERE